MVYLKVIFVVIMIALNFPVYAKAEKDCSVRDTKTLELIAEYKRLKEKRRALPQGTFDEDASKWGGRLHNIMIELGNWFGKKGYTKSQLVACMGKPDAAKSHHEMKRFLSWRDKTGDSYLIYHWRGWHDYLFFTVRRGRIIGHSWWFAGE